MINYLSERATDILTIQANHYLFIYGHKFNFIRGIISILSSSLDSRNKNFAFFFKLTKKNLPLQVELPIKPVVSQSKFLNY